MTGPNEDGRSLGFNPSASSTLADLQMYADDHPVIASLDVTLESLEDGILTATIPYNDAFANPGMDGTYHGGIVVTMLDTVMGLAISGTVAADDSKLSGPTITLTTHFHDTSTEGFEVIGEVVRIGSSSAFVEGRVLSRESNALLATAECHWRIYDR